MKGYLGCFRHKPYEFITSVAFRMDEEKIILKVSFSLLLA
jgi:hypothetical protein